MKGTDVFKETIENYLKQRALNDEVFNESFKKEKKNIDDCVTYILNQVKSSGSNGFADDEIYNMAVHYYFEDDIKPGSKISGSVVVNHKIELTEKEIEEARKQVMKEQTDKMLGKNKNPKTVKSKVENKELKFPSGEEGILTLF